MGLLRYAWTGGSPIIPLVADLHGTLVEKDNWTKIIDGTIKEQYKFASYRQSHSSPES
jgi:hypothetical protein